MNPLLQLADVFFAQPVLGILLLRARRSLVTLEAIAEVRALQLRAEAQMAQANALAARERAEIDANVNARLGALGISPGPSTGTPWVAPAVSPLRGYADLLVTLLVYRGDPPCGPHLAQAAEAILFRRVAPALARKLAEDEGHPLTRPNAAQMALQDLLGMGGDAALPAAALSLPRARIGAVLAAMNAGDTAVEASTQDPSRPTYYPIHGAFTLESPWPWIGTDVELGGLVLSVLLHTKARFAGALLHAFQSFGGVAAGSPASLSAVAIPGGPFDTVGLNRAFEDWSNRISLGLRGSRGAPTFRDVEIAGSRGVMLEFRWTQMLLPSFERRYLLPAPSGPVGVVLSWVCPASEAPRWSSEVDLVARSLSFGAEPRRRVRPVTDASTGVVGVDAALRGAWLYDIGQGDLALAREEADRALRQQPSSRRARFARAVVAAVAGDLEDALSRLDEVWPALEPEQRRLVACFGARTARWRAGLRPDGSLSVPTFVADEEDLWAARREEIVGRSAMDLPESFLTIAGLEGASRAAADPSLEAQLAKVGHPVSALVDDLRDAAAVAARAHLASPAAYLQSLTARILDNHGETAEALSDLRTLAEEAERAGDLAMSAWCALLVGDLGLAAGHRDSARRSGALPALLVSGAPEAEAIAAARTAYLRALDRYRASGSPRGAARATLRLAALDAAEGRTEQALSAARAAGVDAASLEDRALARDAAMLGLWIDLLRGAPDGALRRTAAAIAEEHRASSVPAWADSWARLFRDRGPAMARSGGAEAVLSCSAVASALYEAVGARDLATETAIDRTETLITLQSYLEAASEAERVLSVLEERLRREPEATDAWGLFARLMGRVAQIYDGLRDGEMARRTADRLESLTASIPPGADLAAVGELLAMDPAEAMKAGKGDAFMGAMRLLPRAMAAESAKHSLRLARFNAAFLTAQSAIEEGRRDRAAGPLREAREAAGDLGAQKDLHLAMCSSAEGDRDRTIAEVTRYVEAGCPREPRVLLALQQRMSGVASPGSGEDERAMAAGLPLCASLLEHVSAWAEARDLLRRFEALPEARRGPVDDLTAAESHLVNARVLEGLGDARAAEERFAAAVSALDRVRAAQRSERLRRAVSAQRLFVDAHATRALFFASHDRWAEAFESADRVRARSFAESASLASSAEPPSVTGLRATVERLQSELLHVRAHAPERAEAVEAALVEATRRLEEVAPPETAGQPLIASIDRVAEGLREGDLLIAYLYHRDRLLAWAVRPEGLVRTHLASSFQGAPFESRSFGAKLRALVARLSEMRPSPAARQAISTELSGLADLLIAPFSAEIDAARRVILLPYRELLAFPFAALPRGARPLGQEKPITFIHAAALLAEVSPAGPRSQVTRDASRVLVVGNPSAMALTEHGSGESSEAAALPGAEEEARRVAALYDATALIGPSATRAEVLRRLGATPPPSVVHLATHGMFDPEVPLASCVLLAGGEALSADDWAGLRTGADLVILSACHTAGGELQGGEILGLTRMILLAGARAVVVSLWPVHDGLTVGWMTALHEALLAGKSPEEACMTSCIRMAASPRIDAEGTRGATAAGSGATGATGALDPGMDAVRDAVRKGAGRGALDPSWPACWAPFIVVRAASGLRASAGARAPGFVDVVGLSTPR